jgi:p-aminobenzoyl-glutamate transporter AbgT
MPSASILSDWYFHAPSVLLAALIYLLIGRLVLAPLLGAANPALRVLAAITDPVVKTVGAITPRVVPPALVVVFAIMWLLSARILLHQAFLARRMFG